MPCRNEVLDLRTSAHTPSAGAPGLVISCQTRTQLLQGAPCHRRSDVLSLRTFRIDRTNTNFSGCMLFRVFLKCFVSPCLPRQIQTPSPERREPPRPWEADSPQPFLLGLPVVTAIPVAHSPPGTWDCLPEGLCKICSHPEGRWEQ